MRQFKNVSAVAKEKIAKSFKEVTYLPGQSIVREGSKPDRVILI